MDVQFGRGLASQMSVCPAGDQIGHLLWRILNGELPKNPPKVFTMLIGTNDLTAADCNMNETELLATIPGIQYRSGLSPGCSHHPFAWEWQLLCIVLWQSTALLSACLDSKCCPIFSFCGKCGCYLGTPCQSYDCKLCIRHKD